MKQANVPTHGLRPAGLESGAPAFGGYTLRKPLDISAIIVDHVLLLNPSQSISALPIKPRGLPCLRLERVRGLGPARRSGHAAIDVEVPVRGHEWSLAPISLHPPALCCPVICIPQAALHSHGLALGETGFQLLRCY
ncbi:UNVERIFIED_CONTAM: hypothetical protein Sradi_2307600 [Sesamum radiatum]|uniref:Uncharacterized protein n=1 Tax=Sesamum radiatum TaxID=300843 RepID=A0AAW2T4F6_SESRA